MARRSFWQVSETRSASVSKIGGGVNTEKGKKQLLATIIIIAAIFSGTYIAYIIMQVACHTSIPVVVVTSGSMEPTIYRGDILFVNNVPPENIMPGDHVARTGDVIIYETKGLWAFPISEPVVHRVINKTYTDGMWKFTTQGDANPNPDAYLVPEDKVYGKVVGIIPKIGYIKLFLDETNLAIPLLGFLGLLLVISIIWDYKHPEKTEKREKNLSLSTREQCDLQGQENYGTPGEPARRPRPPSELDALEKTSQIINASTSLSISQLAELLKVDEAVLKENSIAWAERFGFIIEKDKIIFENGNKSAFIDDLNKKFAEWNVRSRLKDGKT
ncbi:MAG: signal peptidase I [Candidatus Sigynarchaeota archaeon]